MYVLAASPLPGPGAWSETLTVSALSLLNAGHVFLP
jgi:hypothetical protein